MIIDYFYFTIVIFLGLLQWAIIIEVVLSWLQLFSIRFSIGFIKRITYPMYFYIKKVIPTTFGPVDFTPIIIILIIEILFKIIFILRPSVILLLPS